MTLFKPWVDLVKTGQTIGGLTAIIPYLELVFPPQSSHINGSSSNFFRRLLRNSNLIKREFEYIELSTKKKKKKKKKCKYIKFYNFFYNFLCFEIVKG